MTSELSDVVMSTLRRTYPEGYSDLEKAITGAADPRTPTDVEVHADRGFRSEGRQIRDDPMYDNKPWHNSIGHYDELHHEQFTSRVQLDDVPRVDVELTEGNPYQRAYRGIEDHFSSVMTEAYGLDDPDSTQLRDDPFWLVRFVFMMGTHFTAMPPFHFRSEVDGTLTDTYQTQRRPVAIYCEGIKWLNWALEMLTGTRTEFLGVQVPPLPYMRKAMP